MATISTTRCTAPVLKVPIDVINWETVIGRIGQWARAKESRYVCICNVHSCVTGHRDPDFLGTLANADIATPDGAPIAWMLRKLGFPNQQRINGPDLMWRYCEEAAARRESIYLYGGTPESLNLLKSRLKTTFPALTIAGSHSPPFRALSGEEDEEEVARINASGAGTVWVCLGCPKQEKWMAAHRGRIQAVMIGVGAAFDYHAGIIRRAPQWMQDAGLEWLHRLASEPRRLWRRYLVTNTLFIMLASHQLFFRRN